VVGLVADKEKETCECDTGRSSHAWFGGCATASDRWARTFSVLLLATLLGYLSLIKTYSLQYSKGSRLGHDCAYQRVINYHRVFLVCPY
jgi:hypothetical protein